MDNSNPVKFNFLNKPLSMRGWPSWIILLLALAGFIYLLNPGAGIFEFIPDNLPIVGNLDEAGASMLVWYGLLEMLEKRRRRNNPD
jgi:hypothetical protein